MKLPLEQKISPTKERRVGGTRVWLGTAKQLLEDAKTGNLKYYDRVFESGWNCSATVMGGPIRLSTVTDAVVLMHSPMGCISNLTQFMGPTLQPRTKYRIGIMGESQPDMPASWYCSNITEEEIIFGAETKLKETLKTIDRINHPQSIFIFISCSAGVMGDDIEGIAKEAQSEVKATIVPVRCEAFQSRVCQWGHDSNGHAILKYLVRKPQQKRPHMVNLIAPAAIWYGDRRYLGSLLEKVGIECNWLPEQAPTEALRILAEAAGTVCLCPTYGDYLAKGLEQEYGVPYFRDVVPFGIERTELWLRKISGFVGKEAEMEKLIERERAAVMPQVMELKERWQGTRVFVSGGATRAFHLPHMLISDFGMELVGLNPLEFDLEFTPDLERLVQVNGGKDFIVNVADHQTLEMGNFIRKIKPDLFLGRRGSLVFIFTLGVPGMHIGTAWPELHQLRKDIGVGLMMGFQGVVSYARYIGKVLKNPSLSEWLSAHTKNPYIDSWYEKDPMTNLRESKLDKPVALPGNSR